MSAITAFRLWTEPEHVQAWWRPHGLAATSVEIDVRVGGRYRIGMGDPSGDTLFVGGTFTEVEPPHRLAYTWAWENGEFADTPDSLVTVEFREVGGATEIALTHERLPGIARPAHEAGWSDCLAAIAAMPDGGTQL